MRINYEILATLITVTILLWTYVTVRKAHSEGRCIVYLNLNDYILSVFWGAISFTLALGIQLVLGLLFALFSSELPASATEVIMSVSFLLPLPYVIFYGVVSNRGRPLHIVVATVLFRLGVAIIIAFLLLMALAQLLLALIGGSDRERPMPIGERILSALWAVGFLLGAKATAQEAGQYIHEPSFAPWTEFLTFRSRVTHSS